jgi:nucleotide-binding universal stress UspA family protein
VVVPLDGSETAEAVVPVIESLAPALKCSVILVRVPAHDDVGNAMDYLTVVAERLRSAGVKDVHTRIRPGPPEDAIVELADREHASFIAMATHGRSGLRRWVFGSVTDRVVHTATVPTLVIRAGEESRRPSRQGQSERVS